jgi:uncharacterized protein DUF1064
VDGIRFASKKEARRYQELKLLEKAGEINGLTLQPRLPLNTAKDHHVFFAMNADDNMPMTVGFYVADFSYREQRSGQLVVEDVKGFKTPLYRWKKKHVEAQYGILIREV